jgi:hypothetical protein
VVNDHEHPDGGHETGSVTVCHGAEAIDGFDRHFDDHGSGFDLVDPALDFCPDFDDDFLGSRPLYGLGRCSICENPVDLSFFFHGDLCLDALDQSCPQSYHEPEKAMNYGYETMKNRHGVEVTAKQTAFEMGGKPVTGDPLFVAHVSCLLERMIV